jgi:antitoxin component of RelBE/YafQ-DinJ toxin-antitoxin module
VPNYPKKYADPVFVQVRLEREVREEFRKACLREGMAMNDALRGFVEEVVARNHTEEANDG